MSSERTRKDDPGRCSYEGPGLYEVRVRGRLNQDWSQWFGGLKITHHDKITILVGRVTDQAALRGILCRAWDLNLSVLSVRLVCENSQMNCGELEKGGAEREIDGSQHRGIVDSLAQKQKGGKT